MARRLKNVDRETPMLLPPDMRDWLPEDHIARFIVEAVESLRLEGFHINERGSGSEQYPPSVMEALLIYCYSTGVFSSREIEMATYTDVAVRYILGGDNHPDHDTICAFRVENRGLFADTFVKVLMLAQEQKHLKKVGTIAVDGSKIMANASKQPAVSYERAGEQIEFLEREIQALVAKADDADRGQLDEGLHIPKEIARREERIARLRAARQAIEARFEAHQKEKETAKQAEADKTGKKTRKKRSSESVPELMQHNFTDPDSRIMKAGNGQHFEQAYNAQAAVDTQSMLIVGARISQSPNDKQELVPTVQSVDERIYKPENVLTDSGFYSEEGVSAVEADGKTQVYAAVDKQHHGRTVADLEKKAEPEEPPASAPMIDKMRYRLKTKKGRAIYKSRKETVEPTFGIIKEVMGFRRFSLRGKTKVALEWLVVCVAFNLKRLFNLLKAKGDWRSAMAPRVIEC